MRVSLTDSDLFYLSRPINGSGGFQDLLRRLQSGIDSRARTLTIRSSDIERVLRYANDYGTGGFQGRLGSIAHDIGNQLA